jgi:hypothetical protein
MLEEEVGAEAILVPLDCKDRTYKQRIEDVRADKDKIKKVTDALKVLGFVVVANGVISITIFGKRELFENIFQIKLNRITSKDMNYSENIVVNLHLIIMSCRSIISWPCWLTSTASSSHHIACRLLKN